MMRNWINLFEGAEWPETISGYDLADKVEAFHHTPEDFDDGDIHHNIISFGTYHLRRVPITGLKMGLFTVFDDLVADYAQQDTDAPPIIVDLEHGIIIDGNHRAEAAVKRGQSDVLAYVGDRSTYDPPEDEDDDGEWHPDGDM